MHDTIAELRGGERLGELKQMRNCGRTPSQVVDLALATQIRLRINAYGVRATPGAELWGCELSNSCEAARSSAKSNPHEERGIVGGRDRGVAQREDSNKDAPSGPDMRPAGHRECAPEKRLHSSRHAIIGC